MGDHFLPQKVEEGTRGLAILDLIVTNRDDLVDKVTITGTLGESDHVILTLAQSSPKSGSMNPLEKVKYKLNCSLRLIKKWSRNT